MKKLTRYVGLVLIGFSIGLGAGCKKAVTDPKVIEGASTLPGATNVMAAIEKKDYDGAMAALLQIKQGVTTTEQDVHFRVLARTARDKMSDANDPKAAEAIATLRAMTTGGR
jgi:hypothetical protein